MKKTLAAFALMATAGLTLTACGGDSADEAGGDTSGDFNQADVTFAQQMIPHHEQAIEMAQMAQGRASSDEVLELADTIEAAQGPEIDTLQGWLESWGEEEPSGDMGGMDHGDMGDDSGDMAGMMDEDEMSDLMAASGPDWDRMFLEMMIEHHEGAVEMAQVEVDEGENTDAVALATKIITDQQAEIAEMRRLLEL